ncbi:MAG: tetratricopeptide repeat protein [Mariprofundaceae bacterium]|nr:tetratricopeptide repeat protein [Mariprofundaceae bacterium]
MKKTLMFTCLSMGLVGLFSVQAWAEDAPQDTYSQTPLPLNEVVDQDVKTQDDSSQEMPLPSVITKQPSMVIPKAVLTTAPTVDIPQLNRQEIAGLHLDLLRKHVESLKGGGMFGGLFSSKSALHETLLQDIDIFFNIYPDLDYAAEVLFLRGKIHRLHNNEEQAALAWLQALHEFPDAEISTNTRQRLADLLKKDWDDYAEQITPLFNSVQSADKATRLSHLINQLYQIEDKKLAQASLQLQASFLKRFPQDNHADEVQVLMAHNLGSGSAESGVYAFKKLLALYSNSSYRVESMLAIADLQRLRLKEYDNAAHGYKTLIEQHPTHQLTQYAYQNLALTLNKHLRNYDEAINVYTSIIALYPEDPMTLSALQMIAKLQEKKTGAPRKAVATLRQLATMFEGKEAVQALEQAMKICERKLKDQMLLMEVQEQLVRDFPDSKAAPLALYDMAQYAEKELKDPNQALSLYQQFIQQYPEHKKAKEARKHL